MILILGATGVLGREATHGLIVAGWPVRAATRTPDAAQDLARLGAEVVHADLIDWERADTRRRPSTATDIER